MSKRSLMGAIGAMGLVACRSGSAAPAAPISARAMENAAALHPGDRAPAFTAQGDDGKTYSLDGFRGKYVVLYFYPKDDTPGCTIEAKSFRDDSDKLAQKGAVVLGVSMDDVASHKAFREKYQLNFPLLVGGAELARLYHVPIHGGYAARQTFVIDPNGRLVQVFQHVNPEGHSAEILALLK